MAKHNYTLRVEGKLDLEQVGENINTIFPGFFKKAKAYNATVEGMRAYVEWLRSILDDDDEWAEYKKELPEMEARLKAMEVA